MTVKDLVAVMPGPAPTMLPAGLSAVTSGDFTALLAPRPRQFATGRKTMLRLAQKRQELFEDLMQRGTVIPALVGTILREDQAGLMLDANARQLSELAGRVSGRVQFQVHVSWRPDAAAAHFGHDGPLDALRAVVSDRIADILASAAEETIALPVRDALIANHALLVGTRDLAALDAAVEAVDALWTEGFAIRQIGPSPAVSFASLGLKRVPGRQVGEARAQLGLGRDADLAAIRAARRTCLVSAAEDRREDIKRAAEILEIVHLCPAATEGFPLAFTWSEGRASTVEPARNAA